MNRIRRFFKCVTTSSRQTKEESEVHAVDEISNHKFETSVSQVSAISPNIEIDSNCIAPLIDTSEPLNWNDLIVNKNSSKGNFGSVFFKARLNKKNKDGYICTNNDIIVKILKLPQNITQDYEKGLNNIITEFRIYLDIEQKISQKDLLVKVYGVVDGLCSTNLMDIFQINENTKVTGLVMRYEPGGTLDSIMSQSKNNDVKISLSTKIRILSEIALSVAELHSIGVSHSNLKPDNIWSSSTDLSQAKVRLSGFGLSSTNSDENSSYYMPIKQYMNASKHQQYDGTFISVTQRYDIFCFAMLAWELLVDQPSLTKLNHVPNSVNDWKSYVNQLPTDCPTPVYNMINSCLQNSENQSKYHSAQECYTILDHCYHQLIHIKYDVCITYCCDLKQEVFINHIHQQLMSTGLKIYQTTQNSNDENMFLKSKIILCILDESYQNTTNNNNVLDLKNNYESKYSRPVIPLLLEPINNNFPNYEMKVYCDMILSSTQVFDFSTLLIQREQDQSNLKDSFILEGDIEKLSQYIAQRVEHYSSVGIHQSTSSIANDMNRRNDDMSYSECGINDDGEKEYKKNLKLLSITVCIVISIIYNNSLL